MGDMLQQGGRFPRLELRLVDGGGLVLRGMRPAGIRRCCFTGGIGDLIASGSWPRMRPPGRSWMRWALR